MSRLQLPPAADRASPPRRTAPAMPALTNMSFSERKSRKLETPLSASPAFPPHSLVDGNKLMRDIDRPPPGDVVRRARKTQSKADLAKRRSKMDFFEDAFSLTESSPAKERVCGDALVMAEVKTNVIISDEFTFITELSYHLSTRYQRPVSSIVVILQHGACMLFGGNFDPAYVMAVFALPSQVQPTTNKRNAALIQKHMEEVLGVAPSRGLLRFVPTNEEQLASNGNTVAGEIEDLEKNMGNGSPIKAAAEDNTSLGSKRSRTRKKLSVKSFANFRSTPTPSGSVPEPELTPPVSAAEVLPPVPGSPSELGLAGKPEPQPQPQQAGTVPQQKTAKRKKSFVASMFGRSGTTKSEYRNSLPAVSGD